MREIKFRAWDKIKKEMYDLCKFNNWNKEKYGLGYDGNRFRGIIWKEEKNVILMQYTGLKDKNGKEIYEGDIVIKNGDIRKYIIRFGQQEITDNEMYGSNLIVGFYIEEIGDTYDPCWHMDIIESEVKIIGNIYENQELLKE